MNEMFKMADVIKTLVIQPYVGRTITDIELTALKMTDILKSNLSYYDNNFPVFITKSIPENVQHLFEIIDPDDAILGDEENYIINEYKKMMVDNQRIIFVMSHGHMVETFPELKELFEYAKTLEDKEIEYWYIAENIIENFDDYVFERVEEETVKSDENDKGETIVLTRNPHGGTFI